MATANPPMQSSTDFSDKAMQVKDLLSELASLAPTAAKEQLSALKDSAAWLYDEGMKKVPEMGAKACQAIKRNPMKSAAVGVGLGLLVWWLIARRSDDDAE